jgi:hypothetical protein
MITTTLASPLTIITASGLSLGLSLVSAVISFFFATVSRRKARETRVEFEVEGPDGKPVKSFVIEGAGEYWAEQLMERLKVEALKESSEPPARPSGRFSHRRRRQGAWTVGPVVKGQAATETEAE